MSKIDKRSAEKEYEKMIDHFCVSEIKEDQKSKIIRAIMDGRVIFDNVKDEVLVKFIKPALMDGGTKISEVILKEPTGKELESMDDRDKDKDVSNTLSMISMMTGQPLGVFQKLGSRDVMVLGAFTSIFF